jgi:DNA-binding NtrC family response regulator
VPRIAENALSQMLSYEWPGNVRELKHAVERMVITCSEGIIRQFTPDESFAAARLLSLPTNPGRLRDELERVERIVIADALREHKGTVTKSCLALGISRRALYERMKKYGFEKQDFSP